MSKRTPHPALAFIRACRNPDGGYGQFPGDESSPIATGQAVLALRSLGAPLAGKPAAATVRCLRSLQTADGAFTDRRTRRFAGRPLLRPTWWAWQALRALRRPMPRAAALKRWLRSRQLEVGGWPGDHPLTECGQVIQTHAAVELLLALGVPATDPAFAAAVAFLRFMQELTRRQDGSFAPVNKNIFSPYPSNVSYTWATAAGARALHLLGRRPTREADCRAYLLRCQHPDGGFGFGQGTEWVYTDPRHSRLIDTAEALEGLAVLGRLPRPKARRCAAWIAKLANPDGGFARSNERWCRPSELADTWRAIRCCELLGVPLPRARRHVQPLRIEPQPVPTPNDIDVWVPRERPAQFAALRRVVEPLAGRFKTQFELAEYLSGLTYRHMHFHEQSLNEAAILWEMQYGQCGCRARVLIGLCWAAGLRGRWLWCPGHSLTEIFVGGRWVLFDPTVNKTYRRRGRLLTAFDVHEMYCAGEPDLIDFGNKTLSEYRVLVPKRTEGWRLQWVRLSDRKGGKVEQQLYRPPAQGK